MKASFERVDDRFERLYHVLIGAAAVVIAAVVGGAVATLYKMTPKERKAGKSRDLDSLQARAHRRWCELDLEPIALHEARHTAATWLDHAGVSPKVASQIMGHKTPGPQRDAPLHPQRGQEKDGKASDQRLSIPRREGDGRSARPRH